MPDFKTISHTEFVHQYRSGNLTVVLDKKRAGDFVGVLRKRTIYKIMISNWNKQEYYFLKWLGRLLIYVLPIVLLFVDWLYSIVSFVIGLRIAWAAKRIAEESVIDNMVDDEEFWIYAIQHRLAEIQDSDGNKYYLDKRSWTCRPPPRMKMGGGAGA